MGPNGRTDAELVRDTLTGDRNAFAEVVGRYQTLVCSLAYSATGDLGRSEDLAQETFLAVWRQLPQLREPEKLRAWICGIARNRIQDSIRSRYHEPTHGAASLDDMDAAPALDTQPADQAISHDEATIVWRALDQIPEIYREPLILFHRENQSVERVASALDLTEDAVKQRLVRGRKLLQTEVEKVVEGALRRTAPGRAFTSSVIESLPTAATAAKGGTLATKAAVGATAATKGLIGGGTFPTIIAIIASPVSPLAVAYVARKLGLAQEECLRSGEELELRKKSRREFTVAVLLLAVYLQIWGTWFRHLGHPLWYQPLGGLMVVAVPLVLWARQIKTQRRIHEVWLKTGTVPVRSNLEYCSRLKLLGLPLLHVRVHAATTPVKAWIAVGNVAYGVIFGCGTVAIAPLSLGIFGVGFICGGAFVAGGLAIGAVCLGGWALGCCGAGWMAKGFFAFGIRAAHGFAAYARDIAVSPAESKRAVAYAVHANDSAAKEFLDRSRFFSWTRISGHEFRLLLLVLTGLALAYVLTAFSWKFRQLRRQSGAAS